MSEATIFKMGRFGYGICDRCGESFNGDDDKAEVVASDPESLLLDNLVIHADCYVQGEDVLA